MVNFILNNWFWISISIHMEFSNALESKALPIKILQFAVFYAV